MSFFGLFSHSCSRFRFPAPSGRLTEASADDIVEGVSVASVRKLAGAVRRALFKALDGNCAEVSGVRRVIRENGGPSCHKGVYQRHDYGCGLKEESLHFSYSPGIAGMSSASTNADEGRNYLAICSSEMYADFQCAKETLSFREENVRKSEAFTHGPAPQSCKLWSFFCSKSSPERRNSDAYITTRNHSGSHRSSVTTAGHSSPRMAVQGCVCRRDKPSIRNLPPLALLSLILVKQSEVGFALSATVGLYTTQSPLFQAPSAIASTANVAVRTAE